MLSEIKEQKYLVPLIGTSSSAQSVNFRMSRHVSSLHKKRLRSLALCPLNNQLFVTRYGKVLNCSYDLVVVNYIAKEL
jgi:hypothetical protein